MDTQIEMCNPKLPLCPSCHRAFLRVWVQSGETYAFCDRKRLDGRPGPCGQHAVILADEDVAAVAPLTRDEFLAHQKHADRLLSMRKAIRRQIKEAA